MTKTIMYAVGLALAVGAAGCITQPKIESTKAWEGHYYSVEDLKKASDGMQLDKDESIWLLSNSTLSRLLKNIGR